MASTRSYWMDSCSTRQFKPLTSDLRNLDVCIVGAGVSGLTSAYFLAKAGLSVVVLDDGPVAGGETERTTAHITNIMDHRYFELEQLHGVEKARLVLESHTIAIDTVGSIIKRERIECDFQRIDGYLFLGSNDKVELLEKELKTVHALGFSDSILVEQLPSGIFLPAIKFPRQAQFHVLKYMNGLCDALQLASANIYCDAHVAEIKDGNPATVLTKGYHKISAKHVIVATNSPISDFFLVHPNQAPYRTYVIAAEVPKGTVPTALYWDTEEPYHYLRIQPKSQETDLVILGGEDHRTGEFDNSDERFLHLEKWLQIHVPKAAAVKYRWSGQVYEPIDGLAIIGRDPSHDENIFISAGASGTGMTYGTISGIMFRDLLSGNGSPWEKLYYPGRSPLTAPLEFINENLNTFSQYAKTLSSGDVSSFDDVPLGEGAVMRHGLKQFAIYKDEDGHKRAFDATCKHAGARVCWNSCEKSWDCPAHGSRFNRAGEVVNGPANSNLEVQDASKLP